MSFPLSAIYSLYSPSYKQKMRIPLTHPHFFCPLIFCTHFFCPYFLCTHFLCCFHKKIINLHPVIYVRKSLAAVHNITLQNPLLCLEYIHRCEFINLFQIFQGIIRYKKIILTFVILWQENPEKYRIILKSCLLGF